MNRLFKLINRFVGILLLSSVLILIINVILFVVVSSSYLEPTPWATAKQAAAEIKEIEDGYSLEGEISEKLKADNAWAIYIDNDTLSVVWTTDKLPASVPLKYNASEIANLSRGYIGEYPTFTADAENGLVVLGYPKNSYVTHTTPTWDYDFVANIPRTILLFVGINLVTIFLIYMLVSGRLLNSFKPIIEGIVALPTGETVCVPEKGVLSELAENINSTSKVIRTQNGQLRKKETARANWISGVSHDIRTPLSMIMGYASRISENTAIDNDAREQAKIIQRQSIKIKGLIEDINLTSRLEYEMQPLHKTKIRLSKLLRNYVADFLNASADDNYNIDVVISQNAESITLQCDERLITRAINNLVLNSIEHNPAGCNITLALDVDEQNIILTASDTGIGLSQAKITELNEKPHYMESTDDKLNLRHGMGLLLVKQITHVHGGRIEIGSNYKQGCKVTMSFTK